MGVERDLSQRAVSEPVLASIEALVAAGEGVIEVR
jgi:hypothetical protein